MTKSFVRTEKYRSLCTDLTYVVSDKFGSSEVQGAGQAYATLSCIPGFIGLGCQQKKRIPSRSRRRNGRRKEGGRKNCKQQPRASSLVHATHRNLSHIARARDPAQLQGEGLSAAIAALVGKNLGPWPLEACKNLLEG
ncbi:hypothetical protein HYFRA_00002778 [Hymenoscyphus fraxineus]|uniref:Uncharacterized protein n=1 Tax=Hymenoscyphus fraxineus TaxID=746836 RepID=A0A9N9PFL6_9HELO|nr:hypothetical protein HYFRA_00002778 [Hymenoscyphus fraxineus]